MKVLKRIRVKDRVEHTVNLVRPSESIAGRTIKVIDESFDKRSYLCVVDDAYLIDVDKRDVAQDCVRAYPDINDAASVLDFLFGLAKESGK